MSIHLAAFGQGSRRRGHRSSRGAVLLLTILVTIVLLMMVGAVMQVSRQGRFASSRHASQVAALMAAESGVNEAIFRFRQDKSWAPSSHTVTLPNGQSSYTIEFTSSPIGQSDLSVNNLAGETALPGPRGADTVPPASAYLVVLGRSGELTQRLEVVLQTSPLAGLGAPLVSSGKQVFKGSVTVDGIRDFYDITPVQADIHSNLGITVPDAIAWSGASGQTFRVLGEASTRSDASDAITLSPSSAVYVQDGQVVGAGGRNFPDLDIEEIIANSDPTIVLTPGTGATVVNGPGDYSYSGPTIQGDLVLNDANLFVDGNLVVNGSITGTGSVFVSGDTTFSGAAAVNVSDGHIALYSQGHVLLEGFDGTAYLAAQNWTNPRDASDTTLPLDDVRAALTGMHNAIRQFPADMTFPDTYGNLPWCSVEGATGCSGWADWWRTILGHDTTVLSPGEQALCEVALAAVPPGNCYANDDSDSLGQLIDRLQPLAGTPTVDFLLAKLGRLQIICSQDTLTTDLSDYLANGEPVQGLANIVVDNTMTGVATMNDRRKVRKLLEGEFLNYSPDAPGSALFKGVVYTNGSFASINEVQVVGGVYVEKNKNSPTDIRNIEGATLAAGEVLLEGGCRFTYVEGLLEQGAGTGSQAIVYPTLWLVSSL